MTTGIVLLVLVVSAMLWPSSCQLLPKHSE
jgi:hypothetical protein